MDITKLSSSFGIEADNSIARAGDSTVPIKYYSSPSEFNNNNAQSRSRKDFIFTFNVVKKYQRLPLQKNTDKKVLNRTWLNSKQPKSWDCWKGAFNWRTGVKVSFGISILAFTVNLILLIVAAVKKPGYKAGIGILHYGASDEISKLNTAYHILINILSTGLLTSSSFCMQLLCAPRREDIDAAHTRGDYVDIGIMSFRNLKFIARRRSILVLILLVTTAPLHLL